MRIISCYGPETNLHEPRDSLLCVFAQLFFCFVFPKAPNLTPDSLGTLINCSLEGQTTYPVEVWKLFFQKVSSALDEALVSFATLVNLIPHKIHKIGASPCECCVKV